MTSESKTKSSQRKAAYLVELDYIRVFERGENKGFAIHALNVGHVGNGLFCDNLDGKLSCKQ